MKSKTFLLASALAAFAVNPALAQNEATPTTPEDSPIDVKQSARPFWVAKIGGGEIMIRLDRISSISKHEYLLDSALRVVELTIDTNGNALTRIYYIEPAGENAPIAGRIARRGQELIEKAGRRAGEDVDTTVMKAYPATTHAKTIEFRVGTEKALNALYKNLKESWERGRGRTVKVK